ncbi:MULTISPECIES: response regulator [Cohnella]|uniref:Helix-turn-helix protein n=1 Tax=Cohnella phaseoli TaxID=456490 RepID=A0A3D9I931_9BACL|nr:response regulator [Cohnella phaseoli]RED58190.1 helix-turn-helix protein [Cohnella phaseoli]
MAPYKLLLVDDFFVERENVKEMVGESDLDLVITGEADDGLEALEAIEVQRPDFVLTDIEMPLMDGLELAERIRLQYPDIHVIFFTFYEKFEYARRAVQLGAASFILKPIFKEELLAELNSIIAKKRKESEAAEREMRLKERLRESLPLLADKFKRELFSGACRHWNEERIRDSLSFYSLPFPEGSYLIMGVEIDRPHSETAEAPDAREMRTLRLGELVASSIADCPSLWSGYGDERWIVLLAFSRETTPEMGLEEGFRRAEKLIASMEAENVAVSVVIGEPFGRLAQTDEAVGQAIRALSHKFYRGYGQMIRACDIEERSVGPEAGWPVNLREQMLRVLNEGDAEEVERFVGRLFAQADRHSPAEIRGVCFAAIAYCGQWLGERRVDPFAGRGDASISWESLVRAGTLQETREWLTDFLTSVLRLIGSDSGGPGGIAEGAKAYIQQHYQEAITIKKISDHLHYSPNYLNQVFKQETGETLLEYMTKVRVEKAKALLTDTDRKVLDITTAVGYNHETYFRNVFKHYTGVTPKEYREKSKR